MIIDHSMMETKISRKTVRKSLAHIYGKIEGIEESGARVLGKNIVNFFSCFLKRGLHKRRRRGDVAEQRRPTKRNNARTDWLVAR